MNVNVIINGKAYQTDDLCVNVPDKYADMFEGHNFKDMHTFSMALMFANGAQEAIFHDAPFIFMKNDRALKAALNG